MPRAIVPLEVRFWSKVNKRGPTECWLWTGSVDDKMGYGLFHVSSSPKRIERTHRVALRLSGVEVPPRVHVLHSCDVPTCCNPRHLSVGTQQQNNAERDARGRHVPSLGTAHGRAKLTEELVATARRENWTCTRLAAVGGVNPTTAHKALTRRLWKHVA